MQHHQCQQCQEVRPDSKLEKTRVFYVCKDAKRCRKRAEKLGAIKAKERSQWKDSDLRTLAQARRSLE